MHYTMYIFFLLKIYIDKWISCITLLWPGIYPGELLTGPAADAVDLSASFKGPHSDTAPRLKPTTKHHNWSLMLKYRIEWLELTEAKIPESGFFSNFQFSVKKSATI